ncbi:MAG: hypothetical protein ACK5MN_04415 [Lachnospiraceae bacterium]
MADSKSRGKLKTIFSYVSTAVMIALFILLHIALSNWDPLQEADDLKSLRNNATQQESPYARDLIGMSNKE